jgi:DNA polymerase delta subunit 1
MALLSNAEYDESSACIHVMIYDWREDEEDGKILILGFGNDENGDSVVISIDDFMNYVYVDVSVLGSFFNLKFISVQEFIERVNFILKGNKIRDYTTVSKLLLRDALEGEKNFVCLYFDSNDALRHFYNLMRKKGVEVYEDDITALDKFLSFANVSSTGWIECICDKVPETMKLTMLKREYYSSCKNIIPICKNYIPKPLVLCMDIEVYSSNENAMPDSSCASDKVFMISVVVQKYMDSSTLKKYVLYDPGNNSDSCEIFIEGVECRRVLSERELIDAYFDLVNEVDPDVIIGYNIFSFDFSYMNTRLKRRLYEIRNCSRMINGETKAIQIDWQSSAYGFNNYVIFDCVGRCPVDVFQYVRKEYKLQSYSLSAVSEKFIEDTKQNLSGREMFELYRKGDSSSFSTIADYCIKDSVLTMCLFDKMNVWVGLVEMSNVMRTCIRDLYTRGQQIRVKSQLYKECYDRSFILNKTNDIDDSFEYEGAIVTEPVPGIYKWCIALDFSSLYPSIIISHNICYSTFVSDKFDYYRDEQCHIILVGEKKYRFLKEPKGVVPSLLEKLINSRKETKQRLSVEKDEFAAAILKGRQWAFKISANSVYGSYAAKGSPYLQFIGGAECTTAVGRDYMKRVEEIIIDKYFAVRVYGDTDSCIIRCLILKDYEACRNFGIKISKEVSSYFPSPVKLEFEEVYEVFLLITKKRYAAMSGRSPRQGMEKEVIYKGVVVSRRDSCAFLREIYSRTLFMVMREFPEEMIVEYLRTKLLELAKGDVKIEDLVIRRSVNRNYLSFSNPQFIYSKRLEKMGIMVNPGDRVEFVFVKNSASLQGYKMYPVEIVLSRNLPIDWIYYLRNHIKNPVDQLLELVGMKKIVSLFLEAIEALEIAGEKFILV